MVWSGSGTAGGGGKQGKLSFDQALDDLQLFDLSGYGPNQYRQIVHMTAGPSGKRVPRVLSAPTFLATP